MDDDMVAQQTFLLLFSAVFPYLLYAFSFETGLNILKMRKMVARNYKGDAIPTAGGLLLFFYISLTFLCVTYMAYYLSWPYLPWKEGLLFLSGSITVTLWGWQDDRATDKVPKGFLGHVRILYDEKRMTSGLLKLIGIGATALIISLSLSRSGTDVVLDSLMMALSSHVLNLFDLRPGRTIKFFLLCCLLFVLIWPLMPQVWLYFLPAAVATFLFFSQEGKGRIMLGDTGANYLGFLLGYAAVLFLPQGMIALLILCFIVFSFLAERISFTQVIERVDWLKRMDEWGRE